MNNTDKNNEEDILDASIEQTRAGFLVRLLKTIFHSDKKIGELNGSWAAAFKLSVLGLLCLIPTLFGWMIWVSSNIYASQYHINSTYDFARRLEELEKTDITRAHLADQITRLSNRIDDLPDANLYKRVETVEGKIEILNNNLKDADKINTAEHTRMLTLLEYIVKQNENKVQ